MLRKQSITDMKIYALSVSPLKPFIQCHSTRNTLLIRNIVNIPYNNKPLSCGNKSQNSIRISSWSLNFNDQYTAPLCKRTPKVEFKVKSSAAVPQSESNDNEYLVRSLQLGSMFAVWYLLNISFNIYNKQVLKVYPFPSTITAFQFGCGTMLVLLMWTFNLHPKPNVSASQFAVIFMLAVAHSIGNLLTNISLGKVAVSFTHTIKALEPFFTVLLSVLFLRERPSLWVVSSLLPIVGGVALASFTEASFNWTGFVSAMASNLTNQSRNVLSKKFMVNEETLDNINIFSIITIISFLLLTPAAILIDGVKFTPAYLQYAASQGLNVKEFFVRSLLAAFCFHTYQQVSYMILQMVSPVTHAIGNCVKRVVVIVSSIIVFQTPASPTNSLGTAIALAGVFLYSRAKKIKPKKKLS